MPIIFSKDEVAKREVKAPPPVFVKDPSVDAMHAKVAINLAEAVLAVSDSQASQAKQVSQMSSLLAKTSGKWIASVKSRDQHGRILTLEFKHQS